MITVAYDPGKQTGWASLDSSGYFDCGELDWLGGVNHLHHLLTAQVVERVICERFIITGATAKKSQQTWSLEAIGCYRWLTEMSAVSLDFQAPAEAKKFMTDERLKILGWWLPGKDHARDAARHLGLALVRSGRIDAAKFL